MGGVDMADQLRKYYSCRRRSRKWWLPLFYFMVDISVVNSYILHRDTPHATKLTIKEFILDLAGELMSKDSTRKRPAHPSLDAPPSARFCERHFPARSGKKGQCRICSKDGIRRRVVYCCLECDPKGPVFLCAEPCFRLCPHENLTPTVTDPPFFNNKLETFFFVFPYSLCITQYN